MFHGRKIFLGGVTAILVTEQHLNFECNPARCFEKLENKIFIRDCQGKRESGVSAFTCNVCLPEVKGNKASKDTAMLVRANITRMWPDIPERDMGECTHLERSAKFMLECPIDDEFSACSKIHNDDWFALTCGRLTKARGAGCYNMKGDYKLCNCVTPLCNSPAGIPMPVPALLTASLAAVLMKLLL